MRANEWVNVFDGGRNGSGTLLLWLFERWAALKGRVDGSVRWWSQFKFTYMQCDDVDVDLKSVCLKSRNHFGTSLVLLWLHSTLCAKEAKENARENVISFVNFQNLTSKFCISGSTQQFFGSTFSMESWDWIEPKSKSGENWWTRCVSCCRMMFVWMSETEVKSVCYVTKIPINILNAVGLCQGADLIYSEVSEIWWKQISADSYHLPYLMGIRDSFVFVWMDKRVRCTRDDTCI